MVELRREDTCLEVFMISPCLVLPREEHLIHLCRMFACLKKHHNTELLLHPSNPSVDASDFERRAWMSSEFGRVLNEGT